MLLNCFYSFCASLGFGIIFNIRGKNLFFASLGGSLSWFIYSFALAKGINNISCFLMSGIVFSIYSEIMARLYKAPVTTFTICALIPLVPGGGMYYTMYEIVQGNINNAVVTGIHTIASAGSLAIGILLVSSIMRLIKNLKIKYK